MEDLKSEEYPCTEYLAAQPESLEQIFYMDNSTVYMHEGQYYLATDNQMMLLDHETTNQELAVDSAEMVQVKNEYIHDEEENSNVLYAIEDINQQEAVYVFNIIEGDQSNDDLNNLNEHEDEEEQNIELNENGHLNLKKDLEIKKTVTLDKLLERAPKTKDEWKPESDRIQLSTYLSGKLMYGNIHDVRKVESDKIQLSTYLSGKLMYGNIHDVRKVDTTVLMEEYYEIIGKTLVCLMQMDSLRKSFENNPLIIKVNELESSKQVYKCKIHGFMRKNENKEWSFINFNNKLETDAINKAKIRFRFVNHVCVTITLSRFMENLKATKVVQSLEQKEYTCIVCYKEFESTKGLQHHYFTHLDTDPDLLQPSEIEICTCEICKKFRKNRTLQNHECNICEQKFKDAWTMKRHVLKHTGVKPHTCNLCDKSFTLVGDLNTHRKTHYGAKVHVYVCGLCGRTFSRQGNLLRHAGIHNNGEHKCHLCGSSYQYASSLTRHIMQTHVSTNT